MILSELFLMPDWIDSSLCSKVGDPSDWFPVLGSWNGENAPARYAIEVCGRCPVRTQCLEWTLGIEVDEDGTPLSQWQRHGIFGGLIPKERAELAGVTVTPRHAGGAA